MEPVYDHGLAPMTVVDRQDRHNTDTLIQTTGQCPAEGLVHENVNTIKTL